MDTIFSLLKDIDAVLVPLFRRLGSLPSTTRDALSKAWPVAALLLGVLQLLSAYSLWHAGHITNSLIQRVDQLANRYGYHISVSHLGLFYWVSLVIIALDACIFFLAYLPLTRRQENGWLLLLLAMIMNIFYGIAASLDAAYGGAVYLAGSIIGSLIGLYVLYEVRETYVRSSRSERAKNRSSKSTPSQK